MIALIGLTLGLVLAGVLPALNGHALDVRFLAAALAPAAGVAAIAWRWARQPGGFRDWTWGGVVDVVRDDPYRLTWSDWEALLTREGTIDRRAGVLRLERRLFFGLVPLGHVERPVGDFYRVEVTSHPVERTRRGSYGRFGPSTTYVVRYDFTLSVVTRSGDRLVVLDLSVPVEDTRGDRFVGHLRGRLEEIVGFPGKGHAGPFAAREPS